MVRLHSTGVSRFFWAALSAALLCLAAGSWGQAPGTVYLVLGSDTAIWDGMDTSRFHCHYNIDLYTNQTRNAYQVMDPAFRAPMVDSYGQTLKMTWWMMAGQIFRYADNTDVPVPNTMTLHLMKQYHGTAIEQFGDELTLHYHTFAWTNYSGGTPSWVQAASFLECQNDFDFTVAQFLLEEGVYPVSFRSGWEWMSNDYQNHLNLWLPFSLEATWRTVWTPYHPATSDYRIPGDGAGWNTRSIYMSNLSQSTMDAMFAQAAAGTDQLACIWAHLPESDFLVNISNVNARAQLAATRYPSVKFRYCTAVEAMQRWLQATGETVPQIQVSEQLQGESLTLHLQTDKAIFQAQPFVACKDIYRQTTVLPCRAEGSNAWQVTIPFAYSGLCRVGIAVTDASGHLTTRLLDYHLIPDPPAPATNLEVVVDNPSATVVGAWSTGTSAAGHYGADYRYKPQGTGSAYVQFAPTLPQAANYQVCLWYSEGSNRTTNAPCLITYNGGQALVGLNQKTSGGQWTVLGTFPFAAGTTGSVKISDAFPDAGQVVIADAVRFALPSSNPPALLSGPLSQTVNAGEPASFFVLAAGPEPLAYQWQFNGTNLPGATGTSYTLDPVRGSDAGSYSIRVANADGVVVSNALLSVIGLERPPGIVSQPQSQTVPLGAPAALSVVASGAPPLAYQWWRDNEPLPGATSSRYVIPAVGSGDAGAYQVLLTNANGFLRSSNAVLTVVLPQAPVIVSDPESQAFVAGGPLALNVTAQSAVPVQYQWRRAAVPLTGTTAARLFLSPVQPADAGDYDVIVTNGGGAVTSAVASVSIVVVPPPQVTLPGRAGGPFQLALNGTAGYAYLVSASANLVDWLPLTTTAFGTPSLLLADTAGLPQRFYRTRGLLTFTLTDFEAYSPGTAVLFQNPAFSGTTAPYIDTTAANFARVTNTFPAGHAGSRVLQVAWTFKSGAANWLRLTATGGPVLPNPTVDFRQGLQFDVWADRPLYLTLGLRETSTTAPLGGNGGYDGLPIEWVGGSTDNRPTPPKGRLVPAGQWSTLRFFLPSEPVKAYTGNARLESTTGKGVLEQLAIVPADTGAGPYTLYLDNFQVIFITPP